MVLRDRDKTRLWSIETETRHETLHKLFWLCKPKLWSQSRKSESRVLVGVGNLVVFEYAEAGVTFLNVLELV